MQKKNYYKDIIDNEVEKIDFREQINTYLVHWRWFLISLGIGFILAFLYLRYTPPSYEASTTILVKDEKKGGILSELSAFADLGIGGNIKSNVDNEIEILKSRTLLESTIQEINLNVFLFLDGNITDRDIYADTPIKIDFLNKTTLCNTAKTVLKCNLLNETTFSLEEQTKDKAHAKNIILSPKKEFKYGEIIVTTLGNLVFNKTVNYEQNHTERFKTILIVVKPLDDISEVFKKQLKVEPVSKMSSVVTVSISDPVAKKAEDFLNTMIEIYNKEAAEDKNFISENTSAFIAHRLALITQELDGVEKHVENFKKSNNLTDIDSEAKLFIEGVAEYDKKDVETEIQLNIVSSMLDFIKKSTNSDLLPSNMITDKGDTSGLITSYNQLVLDRNRILKSATTQNPAVVKLDQQITSLKANVETSLKRTQSNLAIQNRDIKNQEGAMNTKIAKIPMQERQFRVIARQQKVKEELYLYLLQKREEIAISLSVTEANARVIDKAKADKKIAAPKKKIIYLGAILMAIIIPFGFIYTSDLLDTKIKSRLDLEGKTRIPFIGDIPTSNETAKLIKSESRTSSAEAIRIVRTNLEFMLNKVAENTAKTIFVTSTLASEGKTFVSANLAATFALSGSRVLLIGLDIRNPKFDTFLNVPNLGLTNYLSLPNAEIDDYIIKFKEYQNLFILPSGVIPPNPTELLMNKKVNQLFTKLKKEYDYIIVDTAPVSLVTDTLLVAKNADTFVYVMRANFLEKRMLSIANAFYKENKLPNMCIVLNDTHSNGYSYGYGEKEEKKSWFKKIIS